MPKSLKNFVPIDGFENYMVDRYGRIYSLKSNKLLKPTKNKGGYLQVGLPINKKFYSKNVHRLVATAFIINPENKPQINHIDGNKKNNTIQNLEWSTSTENIRHARKIGLNTSSTKLTKENVYDIWKKVNCSVKQTSREFGVSPQTIWDIYKGNTWFSIFLEHANCRLETRRPRLEKLNIPANKILYIQQNLNGLTQKELGKICGCSSTTVHNIQRKKGRYKNV